MVAMEEGTRREYEAVQSGAGLLDLSARGKLEVTGPDRESFLQAMISNDVKSLEENCGCYATFLAATGKMVSDFFCYKLAGRFLLDVSAGRARVLAETLERYIIMDEVLLQDFSSRRAHFSLQGPRSAEILRSLLETSLPAQELQVQEIPWQGETLYAVRRGELAETGFEVIGPAELGPDLRQSFLEKGARMGLVPIGNAARDILRMEAGIPLFGIDMDESHNPLEARLRGAVSFTKGCYIGQEVVSKATYIGGVPRLLMGLTIDSHIVPARGSRLLDASAKPIGSVTSAVFSLRLNRAIAFAYIKRKFAHPGERYDLEVGPGARVIARVAEDFRVTHV